jgi:hypothetical protein
MFPFTTCAGLLAVALFTGPLLLQTQFNVFQPALCDLNIPAVSFSTVLLKTVNHVNHVSYLRKVDGPVPGALVSFFKLEDASAYRGHTARCRCWLPSGLKLPERETKRSLDLIGEARENFERIALEMELGFSRL